MTSQNLTLEHNATPSAPWELRRQEEGNATNEYSMVSMRLRKALVTRIDNMANYLGTNKSQFMRHAVIKLLNEEENKIKEETMRVLNT